jgi:Domain of unknown function (DUF4091)
VRRLLIPALLGIYAISALDATGAVPLKWWIADSLQKVSPDESAPRQLSKSADIYAARNEFEPFQIVLHAENEDASGVDIQCSDLRSPQGGRISSSNITIYAEQFMHVTRPSLSSGTPASWPDALIPRIDRYENERRNAFPLVVRRGRNQPVWIEVYVPETAQPGKYEGLISILRGQTVESSVPVHLTVWAFSLPSTSTLKSSFGLNGTTILKQHLGSYTTDEDLYRLTALYAKAALLHRISVHGGSMVPPKYQYSGGHVHVDWGSYDKEVGPFLDGTVLLGGPLPGARATSVDLRTPATFDTEQQRSLYLAEWVKHFGEKGWADRLFLYLWDEPAPADFPQVVTKGLASLAASSGIRNLVTIPYAAKLDPVVQIWVPLINCLEKKSGYDDFCAEAPPLNAYQDQAKPGKSLWFYQSCASHGCNIPGGEYFKGWPSYMIDAPATANRVMQWVAWKYRMQGELYYSMNEAYGQKDPWKDIRLFGGNGDGTLFYPGRPADIGGHTDIPIESIRLKLIRKGMEDYEYLALLAKLKGQNAADEFADRIVQNPWTSESRSEVFLEVRRELGETLNRLATDHPEGVTFGAKRTNGWSDDAQ